MFITDILGDKPNTNLWEVGVIWPKIVSQLRTLTLFDNSMIAILSNVNPTTLLI
jgi:hypothetical protein